MKSLYSTLIAGVVSIVFAPMALADPGTTWDKAIAGPARFQVLAAFGGAAVLDRETGRVWERRPSSSSDLNWFEALRHCYDREIGNRRVGPLQRSITRKGWRLPTVEELASLLDTSEPDPMLPAGHPFSNVQANYYWSATSWQASTDSGVSNALLVGFHNAAVANTSKDDPDNFVWCVRGGQGIDGVQ